MTFKYIPFSFLILISLLLVTNAIAQDKPYKGAEVYGKSGYDFTYGKIEVRMKTAKGSGILSTFFTWKEGSEQSSVFWEEIDVEVFGKNNAMSWQSNIITGYDPHKTKEQVHNQIFSLGDDFHTYTLEWAPDYIEWRLDGSVIRKTAGKPATDVNNPAGIRFNIWAATLTSWAGSWDDNVLPQFQFVNWIKYYRYEEGEFILDWLDDFSNFNTNRWSKANWTFDENRADFEPLNAVVQDGMLILCLTKAGETGFNGAVPQDTTDVNFFDDKQILVNDFVLEQNYPNPFNHQTNIKYSLRTNTKVNLSIYDINGRLVNTLVNDIQSVGVYSVKFDATGLPSGIYMYKMQTGRSEHVRKMVFIK
jgi:endo-1,3-1,4-beta-glycanase ExoK